MKWMLLVSLLLFSWRSCLADGQDSMPLEDDLLLQGEKPADNTTHYEEEDWGEGLKVLVTYRPDNCQHKAKTGDIIHYHYVGRLGSNGQEFGKSFDYDSPYIVSLGHGRIIAGMDRGLMDTCLWERRRITIPPHLGYGERGVGETIPGNAVLVFYIRMIKIERDGHALGEDERLEDIWQSALYRYTDEEWNQTIDLTEEALRLFNVYENQTLLCLKECQTADNLSASQQKIAKDYAGDDESFVAQFLVYATRGKCLRDCKARTLPAHLRYIEPSVVQQFRQRKPFSYLHFAYYQLKEFEEAARCCFTFYHYNPTDERTLGNLPFYREQLGLEQDQFVSREPIVSPSQTKFVAGKKAYNEEKWAEAVEQFESSLLLYQEELSTCRLLCEDVLSINLTQPDMNEQKRKLFEEHSLVPDAMEYYDLLALIVQEVLSCRVGCMEQVATKEGEVIEGYLPVHFNFLQYSYYKLEQLNKAVVNAATFIALEPSDVTMADNIRYYKSELKIDNELFVPRDEYVALQEMWETEKRLLHYAEHGEEAKRSGQRGEASVPSKHAEL
ncbi:endoplasmic reticulum protein SC65-like [Halichondria panicea]|uniref:endoplasmic reticulum protein SC65-like n=1 Tax=Halichondria panicea TaxID=6063 RepID=UPI00312B8BC0